MSIYDGRGIGKGVVHGAQRWEEKHMSKEAHPMHLFTHHSFHSTNVSLAFNKCLVLTALMGLHEPVLVLKEFTELQGRGARKETITGSGNPGEGHLTHKLTFLIIANQNATRCYKSGQFPDTFSYIPKPSSAPTSAQLAVLNWHTILAHCRQIFNPVRKSFQSFLPFGWM